MDVTISDIAKRDITVRFRENGTRNPPTVLVHGFAQDSRSWRLQQSALDPHHTLAYDIRGHGGSSLGDADGTLSQLADDLIAVLEDITGPTVCAGFSAGGTVVLSAAAMRPDLFRAVVVLGTSAVLGRQAAASFEEKKTMLLSDHTPQTLAAVVQHDTELGIRRNTDVLDTVVKERLDAIGTAAGYANFLQAMLTLRTDPLILRIADIACHVDVVGASDDHFCPRPAADILLAELQDARYVEIPDSGHLMNIDAPDLVTAVLRAAAEVETQSHQPPTR